MEAAFDAVKRQLFDQLHDVVRQRIFYVRFARHTPCALRLRLQQCTRALLLHVPVRADACALHRRRRRRAATRAGAAAAARSCSPRRTRRTRRPTRRAGGSGAPVAVMRTMRLARAFVSATTPSALPPRMQTPAHADAAASPRARLRCVPAVCARRVRRVLAHSGASMRTRSAAAKCHAGVRLALALAALAVRHPSRRSDAALPSRTRARARVHSARWRALLTRRIRALARAQAVGASGAAVPPPPPTPPPPDGPPVLEWTQLGFASDHHVGSAPSAHFGLRVRNAGGGTLQASLFITSASARFYVPRPRDLALTAGAQQPCLTIPCRCHAAALTHARRAAAGQERMVDIRAPLYLLDPESHFRENATATIQSNGGIVTFSLSPEAWPQPPRGLRVYQMTNGHHAWHAEPEDAAAQLRFGAGGAAFSLLVLWLVARVARRHAHAHARAERAAAARRKPAEGASCWDVEAAMAAAVAAAAAAAEAAAASNDAVENDDDALAAVRAMQERELGDTPSVSQRASDKAAALQAWHAAAAAPGAAWSAGGGSGSVGDEPGGESEAGRSGGSAGAAALCTVCLARPRDTVILPCRHVALCLGCARRLAAEAAAPSAGASGGACPICRGRIENYLQLFMA
jgi:hypothetical protein